MQASRTVVMTCSVGFEYRERDRSSMEQSSAGRVFAAHVWCRPPTPARIIAFRTAESAVRGVSCTYSVGCSGNRTDLPAFSPYAYQSVVKKIFQPSIRCLTGCSALHRQSFHFDTEDTGPAYTQTGVHTRLK